MRGVRRLTEQSLAGRRFGAYEVLEELGAGGMGKVYRAKNVTLERIVALKTLAPLFSADQAFVQRFLKEARAAARLNHPNIVQIYDFGCEEGIYYLAMEYVDGQSLRALLKRSRLGERDAIVLIRHARGRAWRSRTRRASSTATSSRTTSCSPRRGTLKLVDLGIAKRMDEDQGLTQTGQAVGTPQYISPEQIRGVKDIDARADIYSLGATFYQLVTGHAPYEGTSGALVMSMHLTQPLPDPRKYVPGLSEGVCRVLRKMMAKRRRRALPGRATRSTGTSTGCRSARRRSRMSPPSSGIATMMDSQQQRTPPSAARSSPLGQEPSPAPRSRDFPPVSGMSQPEAMFGAPPPPVTPTPTAPSVPAFREEDLHFVEVELAKHIGPLARVLVKKAAKSATSLVGLASALAEQISDEEERRSFRNAVRGRAK